MTRIKKRTPVFEMCLICMTCIALAGCNGSAPSSGTTVPQSTPAAATAAASTDQTAPVATPSAPTLQSTTQAPSTAVVLTLDTGTNTVGSLAGSYTHSSGQVTANGANFAVTANGNSYVGFITGGGNNQIIALPTLATDMPSSGTATYSGTADVSYLDTPSGRLFDGSMAAQVTATFTNSGGTVDVTLTSANGTFGGAAYTGPGQAMINGLVINGATYASAVGSTANVTGFTGATGLNSGAQTVTAQGIFGGPTADETGATAVIEDGANGQALIALTGR